MPQRKSESPEGVVGREWGSQLWVAQTFELVEKEVRVGVP